MTRGSDTIHDEVLVLAAQAGVPGAFESILRRWMPVMRRHSLRLTGDAEAAEDVCQQTCLAMVSGIARATDPARARGWMFQVVTHKSADWIRRRRRDRRLVTEISDREPRITAEDARDRSGRDESVTRIQVACMQLSMDLRTVVSLYYGEGLPLAVIAEVVGSPIGTVKSRLHEARSQLRSILERSPA